MPLLRFSQEWGLSIRQCIRAASQWSKSAVNRRQAPNENAPPNKGPQNEGWDPMLNHGFWGISGGREYCIWCRSHAKWIKMGILPLGSVLGCARGRIPAHLAASTGTQTSLQLLVRLLQFDSQRDPWKWIDMVQRMFTPIGTPSADILRLAPATLLMEDDEGATPLDLLAGTAPFEAGSPDGSRESGSWKLLER